MTEKYALVTFAYPIVLRRANKGSSSIVAAPVHGCSSVHFEPNFRGRGMKSRFLTPVFLGLRQVWKGPGLHSRPGQGHLINEGSSANHFHNEFANAGSICLATGSLHHRTDKSAGGLNLAALDLLDDVGVRVQRFLNGCS